MIGFLLNTIWATLIALVVGFLWFIGQIPDTGAPLRLAQPADVIVVLTGGEGRVREGARLLRTGQGEALYISGTHPTVRKRELFQGIKLGKDLLRCCVTLDAVAANTRGNARETARWLLDRQAERIVLVTADYHMPRSLLEFRAALPRAEILPQPVAEKKIMVSTWWEDGYTARTLALEYLKYVVALIKIRMERIEAASAVAPAEIIP
jgi:uncharacterized SAM-binding protein YcdF (DUF218 family)